LGSKPLKNAIGADLAPQRPRYARERAEPAGHIGHFCLGVQNFNADQALKTLQDRGVTARMRTRGESKEIFLTDPDNVQVQLTDVTYCGGSGPKGATCKG